MTAASNTAIDRIFSVAGFSELPCGEQLGPFTIVQLIGEGGFGAVYLAEQTEPIRRRVAIKVIKPGMDSAEVLSRFETERHALALIDHPNVARVYDAGVSKAGLPFFAMEYVPGKGITRYCEDENLSIPARIDLIIKVCQAVQHAHQKGIIHRDLKPGNILVTLVDGVPTPKVIDFGIAKATTESLADKPRFTSAGRLMGTPEYMSPEQAAHAGTSGADIDTRTDIYAIGVIMYELLCGQLPFDSKQLRSGGFASVVNILTSTTPLRPSEQLVQRFPRSDPRNLTVQARRIRGDLDWITMKAIEKEPEARYETANALAADLRRHLFSEPVLAGPPSALYRFRKFASRNRPVLFASLAIVLALFGGSAASMYGFIQARKERDVAQFHQRNAEIAAAFADETQRETLLANEETQRQRDVARDALAQSQRQRSELLTAKKLLEDSEGHLRFNVAEAALQRFDIATAARELLACEPSSREYEWYLLASRLDDSASVIFNPEETPASVAFTRDGKSVIVASSRLIRYNLADGSLEARFTGSRASAAGGAFQSISISPDGSTLAAARARGDAIELYDIATAKLLKRIPLSGAAPSLLGSLPSLRASTFSGNVRFSPDGKLIAVGGHSIHIVSASTGEIVRVLNNTAPAKAIAFCPTPSALFLAVAATDATLSLYNLSDPAAHPQTAQLPDAAASLAFCHRASCLAVGLASSSVAPLYSVPSLTLERSFDSGGPDTSHIAFSPDGALLAAGAKQGPISVWSMVTYVQMRTMLGHAAIADLCFSPTGLTIATAGSPGCCRLWSLEDYNYHLLPRGSLLRPAYALLASDGRTVAAIDGTWKPAILSFPPGGDPTRTSPAASKLDPLGRLWYAALSHGTPKLLTATPTGSLTVTNLHSGEMIRDFPLSKPPWIGGALSADGTLVAAVRADGILKLFTLEDGVEQFSYPVGGSRIVPACFSNDGKLLATCSPTGVSIFNLSKPQAHPTLLELPNTRDLRGACVSFSPDSARVVAYWENGAAGCWDVSSAQLLWSSNGDRFSDHYYSITFSGDGARLLVLGQLSQSSLARLVDSRTGRLLTQWRTYALDPIVTGAFVRPKGAATSGNADGAAFSGIGTTDHESNPADDEIVLIHASLLRQRFTTSAGRAFELAARHADAAKQLWEQRRRVRRTERNQSDSGLLTLFSPQPDSDSTGETANAYFSLMSDPSISSTLKRAVTTYLLESK